MSGGASSSVVVVDGELVVVGGFEVVDSEVANAFELDELTTFAVDVRLSTNLIVAAMRVLVSVSTFARVVSGAFVVVTCRLRQPFGVDLVD